jgi:hypothetical protein
MSQYRDDRDAARLRIEALEARLAEREDELARAGSALAARDDEILRLQRELELAGGGGPRRLRSVNAAWASRLVGAATGVAVFVLGAGVVLVRGAAPPPVPVAAAPVPERPIHADPVDFHFADRPEEAPRPAVAPHEAAPSTVPAGEQAIVRQVAPRVWGGRAARDEARFRKSLCYDEDCREQAREALEQARESDP